MKNLRAIIRVAILLFACNYCNAGINVFNSIPVKVNTITGATSSNPVQIIRLKDAEYNYMIANYPGPYPFINHKIKDYVSLQYTGALNNSYSQWSLTVNFNLLQWDTNGASMGMQTGSLTISYNPATHTTETYRSDFESDLGDSIQIQVTGVNYSNPSGLTPMPNDIEITSRIEVDRYWKFDQSTSPSINNSINTSNNSMRLAWSYLPGAESYDVEWLFVSGYVASPYNTPDFTQATRINTTDQTYVINLTYDAGTLYYRIRGVNYMKPGSTVRKEGVWSTPISVNVSSFDNQRNWTYAATYSEQGKKKEVLRFVDGSMRERQKVTQNNAQHIALVSEDMYDYEGRPSVTTLPAADNADDSRLMFYNNFNLNIAGQPYSRKDFDVETASDCPAQPTPPGISTVNGAGNYYSQSNPLRQIGLNATIPDAGIAPYNGSGGASDGTYPFTQTIYGLDGKVAEEAGAGTTLNEGSGHTTKIYYATALQADIDKVFGSEESGDASHYQETLTQDANGMVSVAYTNLSGKVVATSLISSTTPNLQPLSESNESVQTYTSALGPNTFVAPLEQMQINSDYPCKSVGTANFTYNLIPGQFSTCIPQNFVGSYDLSISITDACNNIIPISMPSPPSGVTVSGGVIQVAAWNTSLSLNFSVNFTAIGAYNIHKVLSIDAAQLALAETAFEQSFPGSCAFLSQSQESSAYSNSVNTTNCMSCTDACTTEAQQLYPNDADAQQAYITACQCNMTQTPLDPCASLLGVLKNDMSPGGQYFDNRNAYAPTSQTPNNLWMDNNRTGWEAALYSYLNPTSGTPPCPAAVGIPLNNWNDVVNNWQDCFADFLVTLHPEYCRYLACQALDAPTPNASSNSFDNNLAQITTYSGAGTAGYLNTTPYGTGMLNADPFFNTNPGSGYYGTPLIPFSMAGQLANYTFNPALSGTPHNSTMWEYAVYVATNDYTTTATNDQEWQEFVGLYTQAKRMFVNAMETSSPYCQSFCDQGIASHGVPDGIAATTGSLPSGSECSTPSAAVNFLIRDPDYASGVSSDISNMQSNPTSFTTPNTSEYVPNCNTPASNVFSNDLTISSGTATIYITECNMDGNPDITCGGVTISAGETELNIYNAIADAINKCNLGFSASASMGTSPSFTPSLTINQPASLGAGANGSSLCLTENNGASQLYSTTLNFTGGANVTCPTLPNVPNCLCTYITQLEEQYRTDGSSYPGGSSAYIANLLNNAYGTSVDASDVAYWEAHCAQTGQPVPQGAQTAAYPTVPAAMNCDPTPPCMDDAYTIAGYYSQVAYQQTLTQQALNFVGNYEAACFSAAAGYSESMTVSSSTEEYHYTLYYYDLAGNLTRTVPPAGVNILSPTQVQQVADHRLPPTDPNYYAAQTNPTHTKITYIQYNTLDEHVQETTPDDGTTYTWYDAVGRFRFSQNAQQAYLGVGIHPVGYLGYYSYAKYDYQGRMIETGQSNDENGFGVPFYTAINNESFPANTNQVTQAYYDAVYSWASVGLEAIFDNGKQHNLRGRIATILFSAAGSGGTGYDNATHYSYDEHGNINNMVQENSDLVAMGQQFKKMRYSYDLVSNNLNELDYQPNQLDRFIHRYEYDADNNVTNVYTSVDSVIWDQDAKYFYYIHKTLARDEKGQDKVQGSDYAYTLQNWLKGVNSNVLSQATDIGQDGSGANLYNGITGIHANVAQDAYGFTLNYFAGDYTSISPTGIAPNQFYKNGLSASPLDLFDGNIKEMAVAMTNTNNMAMGLMDHQYYYDQLNRLIHDNPNTGSTTTNNYIGSGDANGYYNNNYTYDPDGNITSLNRFDGNGVNTNNLAYNYVSSANNLLDNVQNSGVPSPADIQSGQSTGNYTYNKIGELIADVQSNIATITWSIYGKVLSEVGSSASTSNQPDIDFTYDARGNRLEKLVKPRTGGVLSTQDQWTYTYYVYDVGDNLVATYNRAYSLSNTSGSPAEAVCLSENPIYGLSREGDDERNVLVAQENFTNGGYNSDGTIIMNSISPKAINPANSGYYYRNLGNKDYELTDQLGNVLQTVSDRKLPVASAGVNSAVNYYIADVTSATDYYPYGQSMPNRNSNSPGYRFGYCGKEHDNELKGNDNSYDYGMRMYDPRLGRWSKPDNLELLYQGNSPYSYGMNSPISVSDANGDFDIDCKSPYADQLERLTAAVRRELKANRFLMNELIAYTGFSEDQINLMLQDGYGPKLTGGCSDKDASGQTIPPATDKDKKEAAAYTIQIGLEYLDENYADVINSHVLYNAQDNEGSKAQFNEIVTLLHEYVHVGNFVNGTAKPIKDIINGKPGLFQRRDGTYWGELQAYQKYRGYSGANLGQYEGHIEPGIAFAFAIGWSPNGDEEHMNQMWATHIDTKSFGELNPIIPIPLPSQKHGQQKRVKKSGKVEYHQNPRFL